MDRNPYQASETSQIVDISAPLKKPKSAWIVQALACTLATIFLIGAIRMIAYAISNGAIGVPTSNMALALLWRIPLVIMGISTVIGIQRRSTYGWISGMVFISLLIAITLYGQLVGLNAHPLRLTQGFDVSTPEIIGELIGEIIGFLLFYGAFAYWFYAFGFTEKARKYFQRTAT
jgi:hypothetical protein